MKTGEVSIESPIYRSICRSLESFMSLPKPDPTGIHSPSRTRLAYHRLRNFASEWFFLSNHDIRTR
jgi:hypothetical protein